jgi:hypothetical protein
MTLKVAVQPQCHRAEEIFVVAAFCCIYIDEAIGINVPADLYHPAYL